jgi:transmembrane sensor
VSDPDTTTAPGAAMTVTEVAAYWWVRRDAGAMAADEQQAFEAWCAASPTHREAYARAQRMWSHFEQQADPSELRALRTAALGVAPEPKRWPRMAAMILLCAMTAALAITLRSPRHPQSGVLTDSSVPVSTEKYSTARNERSTITLSDGSVVTLNLDTSLDIAFTPAERLVRITHGQAFFEVAKNPIRPFVVAAADRRVTALGTQFDVRLDPDRVEVILLEGKVAVDHAAPSMLERLNIRQARIELKPGEKLIAALGEPVAVIDTNAQSATSWRQGWVAFENATVADAVAELNRYSERPLIVPDESVRNLRLSGVFRVGQPDRFAAIIQELLPVKAVQGAHGETLLIQPEPGVTATH